MNRIRQILAPPVFEDEEKTRIARMLNNILLAACILVVLLGLASTLFEGKPMSMVGGAIIFVSALAMQPVMRRGHVKAASLVATAAAFVGVTVTVWFDGSIRTPSVMGYIVCFIVASMLAGKPAGRAFMILAILGVFGLLVAESSSWLPPPARSSGQLMDATAQAAFFGLTFMLMSMNARSLNTALDAARRSSRELRTLSDSLEEQVAERTAHVESARQEAEAARQEAERARQEAEAEQEKAQAINQLNERMRGEQDIPALAHNVIEHLCTYLGAQVGVFYVLQDNALKRAASYACASEPVCPVEFELGEGLVGQVALDKRSIQVSRVPGDYLAVVSSLHRTQPHAIWIAPLLHMEQTVGVVELATLTQFTPAHEEFLHAALEAVAAALHTAQARARINDLLAETQQQAEELQAQEEELRAINEELETQARYLKAQQSPA